MVNFTAIVAESILKLGSLIRAPSKDDNEYSNLRLPPNLRRQFILACARWRHLTRGLTRTCVYLSRRRLETPACRRLVASTVSTSMDYRQPQPVYYCPIVGNHLIAQPRYRGREAGLLCVCRTPSWRCTSLIFQFLSKGYSSHWNRFLCF